MRRVSYRSVLDRVAGLLQGVPGAAEVDGVRGLQTAEILVARGFIQRAVSDFWERYHWPELLVTERRMFREVYDSSSTYAAGDEVFFWGTRSYYQALKAVPINEEPAERSGEEWTVNTAYWGEAVGAVSGDDWDSSVAYVASEGTIVYQPTDGKFYQVHTNHTNQEPPNGSYWGERTDFVRSLSLTQDGETEIWQVKRIYDVDPRVIDPLEEGGHEVGFALDEDGVRCRGEANVVWVRFWPVAPDLSGDDWDSTEEYAVGDKVYFADADESNFLGDFWVCAGATTAGQSPITHAAKWERVEFPAVLREMVALRAAGELDPLHGSGGGEGRRWDLLAEEEFGKQVLRVEREQGQTTQVRVMSR